MRCYFFFVFSVEAEFPQRMFTDSRQGWRQKIQSGGGGAPVDSFISQKNHYLKNALKCFTIFYAYDFMGQSLC